MLKFFQRINSLKALIFTQAKIPITAKFIGVIFSMSTAFAVFKQHLNEKKMDFNISVKNWVFLYKRSALSSKTIK